MAHQLDEVVLLADDGSAVGTAPRSTVHDGDTPLHLAFSCYLFDETGRVLLTRRALAKRTWPGVWTNSFCGHPRPGEQIEAAVHRYARHELGTPLAEVSCVLPRYRYRAVDASGVVENEICPVYIAFARGPVDANPDEVMAHRWVTPEDVGRAVLTTPWALSPWMVDQVQQLAETMPEHEELAG